MRKDPDDQLSLDLGSIPEPPPRPRSRRVRFAPPPATDRVAPPPVGPETPPLLQNPVKVRCGFCGELVTIMEDAAICRACGGILTRGPSA